MASIKQFFLYVTNNQAVSRHEEEFDIAFFIINTLAILLGGAYLGYTGEWQWLPFLIIEYTWAVDNMRHNRQKQDTVA
ncbi:MAG: hypothetical protein AAB955_01500 [Patescibacteria group bacterium]